LKDKNLDINVKDKEGNTPLHIAVDNSGTYGSIIPDLIKKGGDIRIKNNNGQTPMDLANDDVKQMLHL
jgi:ankyrin repeat protein